MFEASDFVTDPGGSVAGDDDDAASRTQNAEARDGELPFASSGWLDFDDGAVKPWCGAVLVAPDVAVTATGCVEGRDPRAFSVGFGSIDAEGIPAARIETLKATPELTAVILRSPVGDIDPAPIALEPERGTAVESVSYLFVPRYGFSEPSQRWTWTGRLDAESVEVLGGAPNCHADPGAGVFDELGHLVGIVIGGEGQDICVDTLHLAPPPAAI